MFWCILIDVLSAVVLSALWNTDWFRNLVKTKIGATLYDGALQNAIDWNEASYVCVYLKSTDSYFAGNIVMIDNNTDGYITISAPVHYDANHSVIASNEQSVDVIMAIPIDDVKRIKIIN